MSQPKACVIAGLDVSGCAGLKVDVMTMQNLGVHVSTVMTAISAQNIEGINYIDCTNDQTIKTQLAVLASEFHPAAIKIGMLGNLSTIKQLESYVKNYTGYVVLDPVLKTSTGNSLFSDDITQYLSALKKLFPLVTLLTPNLSEVAEIVGYEINSYEIIEQAAQDILALGVKSVLIKGGHFDQDKFSQDYWTDGAQSFWLSSSRHINSNYRGTGCVLSSAITACLAVGHEIKDAVVIAKMYINRAIRLAQPLTQLDNVLHHADWPIEQRDLPYLTSQPLIELPLAFPTCASLEFYPVVDNVSWIEKLLSLGVKTLQLRLKNKESAELAKQIVKSIQLAKQYEAKLFINDYWQLALEHGAYGVHLGQEDLMRADIAKIHKANLRLGLSTHCYVEVARAHALHPSYIACGPIFATTSKEMPFAPQGLDNLRRWRATLNNYPIVAIGGINLTNLSEVLATRVNGVAMISAIQNSDNLEITVKKMLALVKKHVEY